MSRLGFPELFVVLIVAIAAAFGVLVVGRIYSKAGYSRWLGLTYIVPLVNIIVLIWFAFADWPALQRNR
jgi:hypothetical protein